jgi:hypothetical protein
MVTSHALYSYTAAMTHQTKPAPADATASATALHTSLCAAVSTLHMAPTAQHCLPMLFQLPSPAPQRLPQHPPHRLHSIQPCLPPPSSACCAVEVASEVVSL